MDCSNKKKNDLECNCTYPGCPRHGICCECLTYHRSNDELPACFFDKKSEQTYNRSMAYFIKTKGRKQED
ncbi:MAG: hypothetical protein COV71_06380 [Candidatus Omnitrophica bacterium CG11_big_fil_rev_8_21_14_0_20_41_12]|nr:MAG: hypothetical protein COV71_06380 [Candidatus Omnitrophica bacterium CG11_big_fil_rev_8_21_14_0_20_41_12]